MAEGPDPNDRKLRDGSVSHFQRTQLAMGECQECKTIRTNLDNITQLISSDPSTGPTWFAQKLEEKAFISNAAGAVVTGLTKYEQVSKLLGTVKGKISISQEPEREFAKFIEILQSDRPLLDLAKKLLQDCGLPVHRLSGYDSERESIESPREKSYDDAPGAESAEGIDHPRVFGCECGDCTFANVLERGCPQATVTVCGLPFLDTSGLDEREKDDLVGKLLEDSRRMMFTFQKLVSRTCTSLEQRGVTPKQLVDHLIVLGPLDPVLKESGGNALHKGLSEMRKADTVGDIFFQIRDYISFFNYEILEHIVEELGTDSDRAEVDQYKGKLRDYCRRRAVECPPLYGMPSKSGHVRIVVKLDKEVDKYTCDELKLFQRNLSGILNLKEYALCLISVDKGCLELTFQMPSFLKQKVFPLSYKQEEALKWEGVVKLQCEEHHIPSKEQTFDRKGEDDLGDGTGPSLTSNTTEGTPPPLPHQPHGRYAPPMAPPSRQAGYECEFVDPPPKAFQTKCPICLNILCDPQETDCCGNNFCKTCIERVQEDDRKSCPICKRPVITRLNKSLKRSLNQLHVRCTHQQSGCDWVGELGELDMHLNLIPTPGYLLTGCEYNKVECQFSYTGCETQLPRKEMAIHTPQSTIPLQESQQDVVDDDSYLAERPKMFELQLLEGEVRVIDEAAAKWEELSYGLHFEHHDVANIKESIDILTGPPPLPGRPGKPTASKVTHNTIHLHWSGPESGAENIKYYTVTYRRMDDPSAQCQTQKTQGPQGDATIYDLTARALYCFKVKAESDAGPGPESDISEPILTSPLPLPDRPGKPTSSKVSHDTIHLHWASPESGDENINHYTVTYRQMDDPSAPWMTRKTQGPQGIATITGLTTRAVYYFKVHAESEHGVGPESELSDPILTNPPPLPGRPSKPTASKVTPDTIHLNWSRPESGAENVKCYTVMYRRMDDPSAQWKTQQTLGPQGDATISGLTARAVYCFKVHAESVTGISLESDISDPIFTSSPPLPGRPGKPTTITVSPDRIHVHWSVPESGADNVKCYTVTYCRVDDLSAQWKTQKTQNPRPVVTISGLAARAVYYFKVHAESEHGVGLESEFSDPILTGPPPLPGRPGKPTASKVTHNTIHLHWSGPESGAENIKCYTVTYRRMDDHLAQWMTLNTQSPHGIATVQGLTARALYCFKVHAECEHGVGPESELSDPILTNPPPLPGRPGKPTASKVTPDTIHLNWSRPESGAENVKCYTVMYRRMDDPSAQWKTQQTLGPQGDATISGLTARAVYCFKVHAESVTGISLESDISDPIFTSSPPLPGRPGKPTTITVSPDRIHVHWSAPESGADNVKYYTVTYRRMDDPSAQWQTQKTQGPQGDATIYDLTARALYCFKVKAESDAGPSPESDISEPILTSPLPLPDRPGKPTSSKVSHDTIHLHWASPESGAKNINHYTVTYRRMDDPSAPWMTQKTQGPQGIATITGLTTRAVYYFKVHAESEHGVGPESVFSDPILTNPPPLPGRPGKPTASKVSHNIIHLNWSGPQSGAENVKCYTVTYRRMDDHSAQWQTQKTQGPQGDATIYDLTARALYCFKVKAESDAGPSPESDISDPILTSPLPLPDRPGKPTSSKVSHNTIHLHWSGPESGAENIKCYTVTYRRMDNHSAQWQTQKSQGPQPVVTIGGLAARALYCFKVHAESEHGVGLESDISDPILTSSPPPPGRPGKPTAAEVTHDTINLTWTNPKSGAENVKCYTVMYRRMDDPSAQWKTQQTLGPQGDATISGLTARAVYCFKVHAESVTGISPESDISDPIFTSSPPLPGRPGKPTTITVSPDRIHVHWSAPESGADNVKCYTVTYCRVDDLSAQWKTQKTQNPRPVVTISGLAARAVYYFKVHAESEHGVGLESEFSDPILTGPPPLPGRPGKPTASKVTHNTIHLHWSGPESGAENIKCYTVTYRRMDDHLAQWMTLNTQSPHGIATVQGLTARALYCFKVHAECEHGVGPESELSDPILTNPPPLPGRPGKPTASKVTPDTIHLNWSRPESGAENVKCYTVMYRRMDDPSAQWKTQQTLGPQGDATISGLTARAVYCFKVHAESDAGISPESDISEPTQTNPPPLPDRPGKPTASKVSHDTIHLHWASPESGAENVKCYTVTYRRMDDPSAQWKTQKTQNPQGIATISGLTERAVYCFRVFAESVTGISPESDISDPIFTSSPPLPGRPGKPTTITVSPDRIHVHWSAPESGADNVKYYTVTYRRVDDPSAQWQTQKTQGPQGDATIYDLTARALYCFKVKAESDAGPSPESDISDPILTSPLPLPDRPGKPTSSKVSHDTIHLHWASPESGAENINHYTVTYRQMDDPSAQWQTQKTHGPQGIATITGLTTRAVYYFKVHAESEHGVGPESEFSDPILTGPPPLPGRPGKPTASKVSHNIIHLNWSGPQSGAENVKCYTVTYRRMDDHSAQWQTQKSQGPQPVVTISGLAARALYCFKVHAESEHGVGLESDISDPILTSSPPLPDRPGKPTASDHDITHNTVHLNWSSPESGENVNSYTVTYRRMDDHSAQWQTQKTQGPQGDATITGLTARALYCFKVQAEGDTGIGPESELSEPILTHPPPVPGRPGIVTASKVSHDTIHLHWASPESGAENVKCYTVTYRRMDDPSAQWQTQKSQGPQPVVTISGLTATAVYCFKVQAESEHGVGTPSDISDPISTSRPPLPGRPGKPIASDMTHNTIHLTWSGPEFGAESIKCYKVAYRRMGDPSAQWNTQVTQGPQDNVAICGLTARADYRFKVVAENEAGPSPESDISDPIMTSPPPVPDRPGKPTSTQVTHDTIHLSWVGADSSTGSVNVYNVSYRQLNDPPTQWKMQKTQGPQERAMVTDLTAKTIYIFKVCAENDTGRSQDSETSGPIQTSLLPPPGRPGKPTAAEVTHDTINLTWTNPKSGAEHVTCYTVTYRRMDDPSAQWKTQKTQGPQGDATISGLTASAVYCFKVHAESDAGISPESDISEPTQTSPPPLPDRPGKPTASKVSHDTVYLNWSAPASGTETVLYYTVTYRQIDASDPSVQWKTLKTDGPERIATINELVAKALYMFRVQAECKAGSGPESELSEPIFTAHPPPPGQPGKPTNQSVTHDTIQLTWASPNTGAQYVKSYTVHYCRVSDTSDHWKCKNTQGPQKVLMVDGLAANTKYKFKVCAEGEGNFSPDSEISDPIETRPPPTAGQPGKPLSSKVTHDSIELFWSKPEHGVQGIKCYTIHYRQMDDPAEEWKETKTHDSTEETTISGLTPKAMYCFQVHAECQSGKSPKSETSDPILTSPPPAPGRPGKPSSLTVTHDTIHLSWLSPHTGTQYVTCYTVHYCRDTSDQWKTEKTQGPQMVLIVGELTAKTCYKFKVYAESENGVSLASDECVIETMQKDRLAEQMLKMSTMIQTGPPEIERSDTTPPDIYKLCTHEVSKDEDKRIAVYSIGKPDPSQGAEQRVLMILGATGAGKSTLINAIVNYLMGVEWEDDFRFKLITDEESLKDRTDSEKSQAHSQTRWITAYTFHKESISRIPYTLTVVDTPGFGDTEGLERDKNITSQIKDFFSLPPPKGIVELHGIGFVAQSTLSRLTPTQKYVFDSVLGTFGKDVVDNIFMMLTFADSGNPPALAAIKEFNIPNLANFVFNNSALFASERSHLNETYWRNGVKSLEVFFTKFRSVETRSLVMTREVLKEREHLEAIVKGLVPQIKEMMCKMNELEQDEDMLKKHEAEIVANEGFKYRAKKIEQTMITLKSGEHDTVCKKCNFTCHYPCRIPEDGKKFHCAAMNNRGSEKATCAVCPGKCSWRLHHNLPYRIDPVESTEEKTYEDLKQRYHVALKGKSAVKAVVSKITKELKDLEAKHYVTIRQAQKILKRLDEIALKPNPLTEVQYIELLIQSEQREVKPGWENRVKYLEEAKKKAKLIAQLQGVDPGEKPDWMKRVEEYQKLYES